MQTNQNQITYAYHFISEALIIFLIAIPILHHKYQFVPYGSYLAIVIVCCILFLFVSQYLKSYFWSILLLPILFLAFYLLNYPLVFAALFSIALVWRFINIRKEANIRRENKYIVATLLLTAAVSIIVYDTKVMLYPFLLFIILFMGYILSQLIVVNKEDRKQINFKLPVYFVGILVLGAGISYFLFDIIRNTTVAIVDGVLVGGASLLQDSSRLLSAITVEKRGWPDQEPDEAKHGEGYFNKVQEFNIVEAGTIFVVIAVGSVLLLAAGLLIYTLVKRNKKTKEHLIEQKSDVVSYGSYLSGRGAINENRSLFNRFFRQPSHPVRKMVYQFEKKAIKANKGRRPFETVEDWLDRIGFKMDFAIYQKVRYGNKNVSDDEIAGLKEEIKEMETQLEG